MRTGHSSRFLVAVLAGAALGTAAHAETWSAPAAGTPEPVPPRSAFDAPAAALAEQAYQATRSDWKAAAQAFADLKQTIESVQQGAAPTWFEHLLVDLETWFAQVDDSGEDPRWGKPTSVTAALETLAAKLTAEQEQTRRHALEVAAVLANRIRTLYGEEITPRERQDHASSIAACASELQLLKETASPDWRRASDEAQRLREEFEFFGRVYRPTALPTVSALQSVLEAAEVHFQLHGWPRPSSGPAAFETIVAKVKGRSLDGLRVAAAVADSLNAHYPAAMLTIDGQQQQNEARQLAWRSRVTRGRVAAENNRTWLGRIGERASGSVGYIVFFTALVAALSFFLNQLAFRVGFRRDVPPGLLDWRRGPVKWAVISGSSAAVAVIPHILGDAPTWAVLCLHAAAAVPTWILWTRRLEHGGQQLASHGTARWGDRREMLAHGRLQPSGRASGFALGRVADAGRDCDPRFRYMGHILTCAGTGWGKGRGAVIPNLLEYPGSAFVTDHKGELFAVTARARREMGQEVYLIDPFGVTGARSSSCNWLDQLNPLDPDVVAASAELAELFVLPEQGEHPHFADTARDLIRGFLVYVAGLPETRRRHIGELRRLLSSSEKELGAVLADMASSDKAFGLLARTAHSFLDTVDRERSSILSTARRHTAFLDDPRIVSVLGSSDFNLRDLKRRPMTLYVVLPQSRISAYSRFLRGFVGQAIAGITADQERPEVPVAFLLDEFAQLGHLTAVENGISIVRGYGAAFWLFVQDLSQLSAVYPKWRSFTANSAQQFFGVADPETAEHISKSLGEATIEFHTTGTSATTSTGASSSGSSEQEHRTARRLLTVDEILRLGSHPIVLISGEQPYCIDQLDYLSDPEYQGRADANPFYAATS